MPNLFVCYRGPEGHEWAHPLGSTHFGKDAGNARGVGRCLAREASGTAGGCCPFLGRPRPSLPSSAPGLRAQLVAGQDPRKYLQEVLSSKRRASLRNKRNRLNRAGSVAHVHHTAPEEVQEAVEAFLTLEASSWKGRRGSALLSDSRHAAFTRQAVPALAAEGLASVSALYLDGRPLSMGIILKSGRIKYTWKIAYDESMGSYSPGYLLFENDTERFLTDPTLDSVDSTSARDIGLFAEIWTERKPLVNLVFDARRSPPLSGRAAVATLAGVRKAQLLKARLRPRSRLTQARTFVKGLLVRQQGRVCGPAVRVPGPALRLEVFMPLPGPSRSAGGRLRPSDRASDSCTTRSRHQSRQPPK
jgi:Acetyltransferase (GNAT) domain